MYLVREANYSDWKENLQNCQKINLLQCWQYGNAKGEANKCKDSVPDYVRLRSECCNALT